MSSNFKLMLRPPPHVEFLQGYPGIPPHGDRKGALVQGTLEVRGDVKAKWVRVELRKIEVLPGGGQNNTFAETIGERPITLWASNQEEFAELKSNDFPFHIAVPEALPPSIALERGAAIKYELIASVMLKGKKSLFKRDPAPITTYAAPIVIEKYDLLQSWPIYSQQQSRQASGHGVTLIANFHQTGFGPGDVVPVEAILRADVPGSGAILRAYELTVRETLIYRSSPPTAPQHNHPHLHLHAQQPQRRVPAAQTRSNIISDQKVPVPVQVFPGSQHKCDLGCQIPLAQTNVSVRTARHIEVNYIVQVKAVLASNAIVSVELPVSITNWQRQASQDAMHRIGYAPDLSVGPAPQVSGPGLNLNLFQATNPPPPNGLPPTQNGTYSNGPPSSAAGSNNIPERVSRRSTGVESPGRNTLGSPPATLGGRGEEIDELGYIPAHTQQAHTMPGRQSASNYGSSQSGSNNGGRPGGSAGAPSEPDDNFGSLGPLNQGPAPTHRPSTANRRSAQRFTIVNADQPEDAKPLSAEEEKRLLKEKYATQDRKSRQEADGGGSKPNGKAQNGRWPTAEEEKLRLYDGARQAAAKTQIGAGNEIDFEVPGGGSSSSSNARPAQPQSQWPSAEEEKRRLYEGARKAAERTQQTAFEGSLPYAEEKGESGKEEAFAGGWAFSAGGPMSGGSSGAGVSVPYASPPPAETANVPYSQQPEPAPPRPESRPTQQWPSAADEKRMLFEQARAAAEKTQALAASSPSESGGGSSYGTTPYSTANPSPYGTTSSYQRSNSTFPDRVASPVGTLSHGFGQTPAGNKTGEELFAAGLAAMGRPSIYPASQPQTSTASYPQTSAASQPQTTATPPLTIATSPAGSAPGYSSGSGLSHSLSQSKRFPSASEEKAAMAYMAAKQRVEQARANDAYYGDTNGYSGGPSSPGGIPGYDSLYGAAPPSPTRPLSVQRRTPSVSGSPPPATSSPPPFTSSDLPPGFAPNPGPTASALSALEEKARLRRQYEEQDAAGGSASPAGPPPPPPPASPPPPAFQQQPAGYGTSAHDEKERMRQMYAEQDAAVRTNERRATTESARRPTLPVPPSVSSLPPAPGYEPNGVDPPPFAGGFINPATFKPLSAAEEKARLRAQYEAEANGTAYNAGHGSNFDPPPPSFDSHYQAPLGRQNTLVPPERSATLTPSNMSSGGGESRGLQRDPSISWGKRPATRTPAPEEQAPKSAFVAPPPPPPLMPKPPAAYIQETLEANATQGDWDRSRSPTPDLYSDEHALGAPPNAPPVPPKPIA